MTTRSVEISTRYRVGDSTESLAATVAAGVSLAVEAGLPVDPAGPGSPGGHSSHGVPREPGGVPSDSGATEASSGPLSSNNVSTCDGYGGASGGSLNGHGGGHGGGHVGDSGGSLNGHGGGHGGGHNGAGGVPGGRLIGRDGSCHLRWAPRGPRAALRRLGDVWTSLLELRWGLMLLTFGATFALSWLLFGLAWYALAVLHGDLGPGKEASSGPVCVQKLTGLLAAFLFALESQLTIGYGAMYPDPEACPAAAALLSAHMVLGLMLDALMTGAFVAKIARPKLRAGTIRFSSAAVVWGGRGDQRRRRLLAFRVANLRPSALLDVTVSAVLYRSRPGRPLRQSAVDFQLDRLGPRPCPYFLFPLTFHHELSPDSPLLPLLRERRWPDEHVELAVFLQATCEGSGTVCRQRTSYLRSEVLADRLFAPIGVDVERGVMDLSLFDVTVAEEESGV
uniref:Inward rectifier potassium channel 13-like n=1 Tax=Petromyzon marinus TaxID=7757 RepID=A0AAJ7X752_PETMA|nr:inward rectifier potassium channel 13-like [Petromyzon marinus]